MRHQQSYENRVIDFVRYLKKGQRIDDARRKARVGTRISRASASLEMTNNGKPTKKVKELDEQTAAQMLINESTRLRIKYEKISHEQIIGQNLNLFGSSNSKAQNAVNEIMSKHKPNAWFRFRGGLKQLAEKHGTSAEEIKKVGNIKTNGKRGEHALIYIDTNNTYRTDQHLMCKVVTAPELTIDDCIAFLKSKGYKVLKPVSEWVEL